MTICYKGNSFKYETESVMKLFLPIEKFGFMFEETVGCGDRCIVAVENELLTVEIYCGEKHAVMSQNAGKDNEFELCRMIYKIMSEMTGIVPEWGCLTGIRPVKKINALIDNGYNKADIFNFMREKYFTSDEKLELAYLTAVTQKKYIDTINKNSFSLFVSIPFCPSRCLYCSFVSHSIDTPNAKKLLPDYVKRLCEEIAYTAKTAYELGLELDTIYIGGGTPTVLSAEQIEVIMAQIQKNFDISKIREYTVEAGRPETISAEKLKIIKKYGATRISVNPQTMNDSVLAAVGRKHTVADFLNAFRLARSLGFDNINTDTIAGLPTDTPDSFRRTIDELCTLSPESITVHALTVKRSADLYSRSDRGTDNGVSEMVGYAQKTLVGNGFLPYYLYRQKNTVDNLENTGFAKQGYECIYNIAIMEEIQTILAAGAGGSSKLYSPSENRLERVVNFKYPYEYISRFDALLDKKKKINNFYQNILQEE